MVEAIEIHQLEENTVSIEKSLANIGNKETPAAPAKQEKDKDKPEKEKSKKESKPSKPDKPDKSKDKQPDKPSKESKPSKEDVNAAAAKGKGKGKDEKSKKDKDKDKDKKKQPCMYFGYDSCSKGKDCPYLHDPNNKYQGPKPKGLQKGSSSSAGAATVLAATCLASQAEPALGSVASSFNAPQPQEAGDGFGGVPERIHDKHVVKGAINKAKNAAKGLLKSSKSKSKRHPCFQGFQSLRKLSKCFQPLPHVSIQCFHKSIKSFF